MAAQYDDFLTSLRAQMVRSAENAAAGRDAVPAARPAAAPRPWHVRPKIALAFIVGVLAPAAVVAVAVIWSSGGGVQQPVAGDVGHGATSAFVAPLEQTPSTASSAAPQASYSLAAVAIRSVTDAWAVGSRRAVVQGRLREQSFILHFDGRVWREAKAPDIGPLSAVTVSAEGPAWALGADSDAILAWDGEEWSAAQSNAPGAATLEAVAAVSAGDVWVVGGASGGPLALHYDGGSWTPALLPAATVTGATLSSVSGSATADVWAVGPDSSGRRGVVMHYDGMQWSLVPAGATVATSSTAGTGSTSAVVASPAADWPGLATVACAGPADVWVGGDDTLHYDGAAWTAATSGDGVSGAASVVSATDIWMRSADGRGVKHFDGAAWTTLHVADLGLASIADVDVGGVAATSAGVVWVVGTTTTHAGEAPLIVRGDAGGWRVVVDGVTTAGAQ